MAPLSFKYQIKTCIESIDVFYAGIAEVWILKSRFSTAKYSNTRQIDASVTVVHTWPHYHLIPYKNVHGKSWCIPCRVWWGMNFMNIVYIYIVASKRAVFHCVSMAPYACLIFWLRNDRSITSPGWSQLPFFLEVSSMSIWSQVRLSFSWWPQRSSSQPLPRFSFLWTDSRWSSTSDRQARNRWGKTCLSCACAQELETNKILICYEFITD